MADDMNNQDNFDEDTRSEIGRKGGHATSEKGYEENEGQNENSGNFKNDPQRASNAGRKGGNK